MHEKRVRNEGMIKKLISNKDFTIKVTMGSNLVFPMTINDFIICIDNSNCNQAVTQIRIALVRTVKASLSNFKPIDDVIATATSKGGQANQFIEQQLELPTPAEFKEPHSFNMPDGSTKYGSLLAPTNSGSLFSISYHYEIRVWHHASFGSDDVTIMEYPVTIACPSPNHSVPRLP